MAGDRMMRYIVPFYFDGAYEEVCRKLWDKWPADMFIDIFTRRLIMQKVKKRNRVESGDRTDNQLKLIYGSN